MANMISVCAFYSNKFQYRAASYRLQKEIKQISFINNVYFYNEKKLFNILEKSYSDIANEIYLEKTSKGFSFWVWKPIIILETLKLVPENSILLYLDIGCNLKKSDYLWGEIEAKVKKHKIISAYSYGHGFRQHGEMELKWAKSEIFHQLKISYADQITPQYQATWIMFINNATNREFVRKWKEYCTKNNLQLVRPANKELLQENLLIENKHDQAIFSCLLKKERIKPLVASKAEMEIIQAARNLSLFSASSNRIMTKLIKFAERNAFRVLNNLFPN